MPIVTLIRGLHDRVFGLLENLAGGWFLGLAARLAFSSVLLAFFVNSAMTKLGSGFPDMFMPSVGAYAQIVPAVAEAAGYDPGKIALFPWKLIWRKHVRKKPWLKMNSVHFSKAYGTRSKPRKPWSHYKTAS